MAALASSARKLRKGMSIFSRATENGPAFREWFACAQTSARRSAGPLNRDGPRLQFWDGALRDAPLTRAPCLRPLDRLQAELEARGVVFNGTASVTSMKEALKSFYVGKVKQCLSFHERSSASKERQGCSRSLKQCLSSMSTAAPQGKAGAVLALNTLPFLSVIEGHHGPRGFRLARHRQLRLPRPP